MNIKKNCFLIINKTIKHIMEIKIKIENNNNKYNKYHFINFSFFLKKFYFFFI